MRPYLGTLKMNFIWPILRHYYLAMGMVDVSAKSIDYIFKTGVGRVLTIVIGGAKEALETSPGAADLVLRDRKGFVRRAIISGAYLLPSYAFGENDLFGKQITGPKIRKIQNIILGMPGVGLGLALMKRWFPFSSPVNVVIGRPIRVRQADYPSPMYVDELHRRYMADLEKLYADNVHLYGTEKEKNSNNIKKRNNNNNKKKNNKKNNQKNQKNNKNGNKKNKMTFLKARCDYDVCGRACRCQ